MLGIEVLPAATYFVLTLLIPESPRHLVRIGRDARARRVLAEVEGGDVDGRVAEIRRVLGRERRPRLRDLRGRYGLLAIVWVGMALSAFQQLVGINVIFYYSAVLWQSVGIAETDSLLLSLFTSIVNIVGTLIAIGLVDRVGRKPLLLAGSAGMTVALAFTAFAFSHARGEGDDVVLSTAWALTALVSASTFVLFFALSWGVVTWVLLGEMFPLRIRAAAMAVATATQWITNWLVTVTFPSLRDWSLPGPTWCTRRSRCCPSGSCSGSCGKPKAGHWSRWTNSPDSDHSREVCPGRGSGMRRREHRRSTPPREPVSTRRKRAGSRPGTLPFRESSYDREARIGQHAAETRFRTGCSRLHARARGTAAPRRARSRAPNSSAKASCSRSAAQRAATAVSNRS